MIGGEQEDDEMEQIENEAVADFYSTITTFYLAQLKSHSFNDDVITLELLDDVDINVFTLVFESQYMDHVNFDKQIVVEIKKSNDKREIVIS